MEKILIIHHNDRDGIVSAAIITNMIAHERGEYTIDYKEENYTKSYDDILPLYEMVEYNRVYILDYSPSTDDDCRWIVDARKTNTSIVWIDHHITSIKAEEKFGEDLSSTDGIRIDGISAAALCWLWSIGFRDQLQDIKRSHKSKVSPKYALELLNTMECPLIIQLTHRYDIWDHSPKSMDPVYFNYGDKHMIDWWITKLDLSKNQLDIIAKKEISDGKLKYDEIMESNKKICEDNGFETTLEVDGHTYTVFAVNKIGGNSLLFGDRINKYDIVSVFWYSGPDKCFRYTIYSRTPSGVDVSQIAKMLGGGGHPHAAGFKNDGIIYKPV